MSEAPEQWLMEIVSELRIQALLMSKMQNLLHTYSPGCNDTVGPNLLPVHGLVRPGACL